jgi:hypothetical protein
MNIVHAKLTWNKLRRVYRLAFPGVFTQDSFHEHDTTLNKLQARLTKSNDDLNKIISES